MQPFKSCATSGSTTKDFVIPGLRAASRTKACARALLVLAGVSVTACTIRPDQPPRTDPGAGSAVSEARAAASGREPDAEPPRSSQARSVDGYKRDAARRIYFRNTTRLFDGPPPPLLKSIVVLSIRTDAKGAPVKVSVLRSNGYRDLEQRAVKSVEDASPLPIPHGAVLRKGAVDFVETWLFRDDGRFQIRSLAEVQASVDD